MHFFPAIISAIAVLAAFFITAANASAICSIHEFNTSVDRDALYKCLATFNNHNWGGMECGGRGWFKGGSAYQNPDNCYDACQNCIYSAIGSFASSVECDDNEGFAECWMGYH
jgi:hypothetical protein